MYRFFQHFTRAISAVSCAVIFVIVLAQILLRNVGGRSLPWGEELSSFLLIWLLMFGAVFSASNDGSLKVSYFREKYFSRWKWFDCALDLLVLATSIVMVFLTYPAMLNGLKYKSATLGIQRFYYLLPVLLGFICLGYIQIRALILKYVFKTDPYAQGVTLKAKGLTDEGKAD